MMDLKRIPYGRQFIDDDDVQAVVSCLNSGWITTGPLVKRFEKKIAQRVRGRHGVAFSSGSTALMGAVAAMGLGPGDEVITTPITFAATANCVLGCGATPIFADVLPDSLLIDPQA
ncbi:DegT/DnrJ/EryC1/StrS aminotransferase like protein, partial [Aduncisulcus paluster]